MKVAIFLGHPAHFHMFKNVSEQLEKKGHTVEFIIKEKDVLKKLLVESNCSYSVIRKNERKANSKLGLILSLLMMDFQMTSFLIKNRPDILVGTYVALINKITGIPVIVTNEDDADVVPYFALTSYPLANAILNPIACNSGKWDKKAIKYSGYQELAYLHPNHFIPCEAVVEKYFSAKSPYFILRFAKLNAHHDKHIIGIDSQIAQKIIDLLQPYGQIYITSERELEPEFEQYRIRINPLDMHHVMAFAQIYIGDSQTMAAEAGVLGTPFVRFNDFVGKIGYLNELENVYKLGFGIKTNDVEKLYLTIEELLKMKNRSKVFSERRQKMLSEKIDYAKFLTWFIENYPESKKIMKENPDYQYNFR